MTTVTPKHPLMEPTSPAWRSKPPFRGTSNGSAIPLQRGRNTVTLHDDHSCIFILVSPEIFTTRPYIPRLAYHGSLWCEVVS